MGEKEGLRKEILAWRRSLSSEYVERVSRRAQERLCQSSFWKDAYRVALYSAMSGEVQTANLLAQGIVEGKKIYLPRVEAKTEMHFYRYISERFLERGSFGQAQ